MTRSKIPTAVVALVAALSVAIVSGSVDTSDSHARQPKKGSEDAPKRGCKGPNFPGGVLKDGGTHTLYHPGGYTTKYECTDGTYCYTMKRSDGSVVESKCKLSPASRQAGTLQPNHSGPVKVNTAPR